MLPLHTVQSVFIYTSYTALRIRLDKDGSLDEIVRIRACCYNIQIGCVDFKTVVNYPFSPT